MAVTADKLLAEATKLKGIRKYSAQHKALIDEYNTIRPLPLGYKVTYDDDWCDAFVSVISKRAGALKLTGAECGVQRHIGIFKQLNIWLGRVRPEKGDIIVWDWQGFGSGWADHIGYVLSVDGDWVTTIEGNSNNAVQSNRYAWNDKRIEGYARPKYGDSKQVEPVKAKDEVGHFVVTESSLRAFSEPSALSKLVETIPNDHVKNYDKVIEAEGYTWVGWVSSVDGNYRWTTVEHDDGRKFVDLKEGTISHGGKSYTEYLKLQENIADDQPVGGDKPKVGKGQVVIEGTKYNVDLKEVTE